MTIFGELERLLADLYPYRVPVTLGSLAVGGAVLALIIRRGWYRPVVGWVDRNRLAAAGIAGLFLLVMLPTGYYLGSPLWQRTTLVEASPLDAAVVADLRDGSADNGTASADATPAPAGTAAPDASSDGGAARLVSEGAFAGADDFHFAEGQALIVETAPGEFVLRFEDFSIRNGPDLFVYLSSDPDEPSGDAIRLGGLKATDGAFNYEVPSGTDVSTLRYAMVWCDRFGVLFATAPLEG